MIMLSIKEMADSSDCKQNKIRQGFIALAETLLESIAEVFPECEDTERVLRIYRAVVKGQAALEDQFIRKCHELFAEQADGLRDHDDLALFAVIESIEHVRELNLREKFEDPDFTQESKDHLWQYIQSLKTYAELYTAVPQAVLGKIESVALGLGEKFTKGDLDLKDMDLNAIGQDLLADLSPEELAGFESQLPDIYASLSDVATSMGGSDLDIGALAAQLAQQQANGGIDMQQLLQGNALPLPGGMDMSAMLQNLAPMLQAMKPPGQAPRSLTNRS